MVRFKPHKKWGGYTFEVKPASQVPSWVKLPPKVLARKMPKTPKSEPAKRIYTLHSMVSKAVYSSRIPGRVEPRVRTEELDSPIPEVRVAEHL